MAEKVEVGRVTMSCLDYEGLLEKIARLERRIRQVDDVLVVNWIDVKGEDYRQALADLIAWNIQLENDPAVSFEVAKRLYDAACLRQDLEESNRELRRLQSLCAVKVRELAVERQEHLRLRVLYNGALHEIQKWKEGAAEDALSIARMAGKLGKPPEDKLSWLEGPDVAPV